LDQAVIEVLGNLRLVYTNAGSRVSLGIAVNEQGLALGHGKGSAKVHRSSGFADAPLLIGNANNVTHGKIFYHKIGLFQSYNHLANKKRGSGFSLIYSLSTIMLKII
jgi:hypothetical protein